MLYLCSAANVTFDADDPEADDETETVTWFEVFSRAVGR